MNDLFPSLLKVLKEWSPILLIIVTAYYAWVTRKILAANKEAVKAVKEEIIASTRPYLVVRTYADEKSVIGLEIVNTGKSAARFVRLMLDKDIYKLGYIENERNNFKNYNVFNQIIPSWPPGYSLKFRIAYGSKIPYKNEEKNGIPREFTIKVFYQYLDEIILEKTTIDLSIYWMSLAGKGAILGALEKIPMAIKDLNSSFGRKADGLIYASIPAQRKLYSSRARRARKPLSIKPIRRAKKKRPNN